MGLLAALANDAQLLAGLHGLHGLGVLATCPAGCCLK